ncbi:MAG: PilZ domain-containing protein [Bryobacteraceae bacterium]|nr:PilZ domain-containing protein [Bryobacteraceae bacterium]
MAEQRKSRRFKLQLPLELNRLNDHTAVFSGETQNVSSNGVLFRCDASFKAGDVVECRIAWPGTDSPVTLRCVGKVIRASRPIYAITLERYEFLRPPLAAAAAGSS